MSMQAVSMIAGMSWSAYGTKKQLAAGTSVAGFTFDAAIRETSSLSFARTKYPVESGGVISDHISPDPPRLQIDGEFSSMTMGYAAGLKGMMQNGLNWDSFSAKAIGGKQRLTAAKKSLEAVANSRMLVNVVSGIDVYSDYAIDSIKFDRSNKDDRLSVSISLSKFEFAHAVWAEITRQSTVKKVSKKGGPTKKSAGAAKTTTAQKNESATDSPLRSLGGALKSGIVGMMRGK